MRDNIFNNEDNHTYSYYVGKTNYPFAMYAKVDPTNIHNILYSHEVDKFLNSLKNKLGLYVYTDANQYAVYRKYELSINDYYIFCDSIADSLLDMFSLEHDLDVLYLDSFLRVKSNYYYRELIKNLELIFNIELGGKSEPWRGYTFTSDIDNDITSTEYHERKKKLKQIEVW